MTDYFMLLGAVAIGWILGAVWAIRMTKRTYEREIDRMLAAMRVDTDKTIDKAYAMGKEHGRAEVIWSGR